MRKILLLLFMGTMLFSCTKDFLDQVPDDRLTFEETFSKRRTVEQYLADVYSKIPQPPLLREYYGGSDEGDYVWPFHFPNHMNIGDWNPTTQYVSAKWSQYYRGLRSASTLIENIDQCKDCSSDRIDQYIAEAKVLRAFFYYRLVRNYGPVIIMPEVPVAPDADIASLGLERGKLEENVNYIVSELDEAAEALKGVPFQGNNAGRMSRPYALALKEKILLFAASPIFNGNSDLSSLKNAAGENLIPQTYDVSKWKAAATAAKAFIDEFVPGTYSLYKRYNDDGSYSPYLSLRYVMTDSWNEEIIYARPGVNEGYNYETTPYHFGYPDEVHGAGGLAVTQEMVDAFFTANGRSIHDPKSGYEEEGFAQFKAPYDFKARRTFNQWANREPRFYVAVTYNGSLWHNRNFGDIITTTWYSGNSGKQVGTNDFPTTGYIVRKNNIVGKTNSQPIMRLAGIYLDYVEALNEYDPGNSDILFYLNKIRERAGIPQYGSAELLAPANQEEMRQAIHKERRIELAFENVRYFDARRWKIADEVFDGPFHGMDINAKKEENFYDRILLEERVFEPRHYLWPIPQDELNSNPSLIQNPGW